MNTSHLPRLIVTALTALALGACGEDATRSETDGGADITHGIDLVLLEDHLPPDVAPDGPGVPDASPPDPDAGPIASCGTQPETDVVNLLNQLRAGMSLSQLKCDDKATQAARGHSQNMCDLDFFSHDDPLGQDAGDRLKAVGATFTGWGENIAMGYKTPEAVHQAWIDSPGHYKNLIKATWTRIGVGYVLCNSKTPYWTQNFLR
jgi:uncharacterized protein YkwD